MELERQENVLVIGHQVHSFFYSIWSLSDGCDSAPCFAGDFALFVSAARRGRITLFALFVGEMCSFMFIHFSVYIFLGGRVFHTDTHISTICHKWICHISRSRCIQ